MLRGGFGRLRKGGGRPVIGQRRTGWFQAWGVGLACLLFGAIACGDDAERAQAHLERADAYRAEGKPAEAIIEYRNALQRDPDSAAAHFGLAQAYLASREPAKAYWEFHETVRLDPSNLDARVAYGNFLLFGKEEQRVEALQQVDAVIAADPTRYDAYLLRARGLEALSRTAEARDAYEKALEVAPDEARVVASLAGYHVRQNERAEAQKLLERLVALEPTTSSYLAQARFYAQAEADAAQAEASFRKALEVAAPEEREQVVKRMASFFYSRERYDDVETMLRAEYESSRNLEIADSMAAFYAARGDRARADAFLLEVAEGNAGVEPFVKLSVFRGRYGDYDGAFDAVERALDRDPQNPLARLRKAELLLDTRGRSGEAAVVEARGITDSVRKDHPELIEGVFVGARLDLIDGEYDRSLEALNRVVRERPDSSAAHLLIASTLRQLGRRDDARNAVLRALEIDVSSVAGRRLLARLNADLGEHAAAVEEVRRVLQQAPGDVGIRLLGAQSLVRLREEEQARELLEAIPVEDRNAEVHFALARLDTLAGNREAARDGLIAALERTPNHPEVLAYYLDLERRMGNAPAALGRLAAAAEARPNDGAIARLHGLALLYAGKGAEAEAELQRSVELAPNDLATYQALAQYYFLTRRFADGVKTYERAVEASPNSAPLHFALGTLYETSGDREAALRKYEEAVRLDPNLSVAKNNLAYLLAEENRELDRALDLAREAKQLLPDSANASDTLGWVLYRKGIHSAAIDYFKEALNLAPVDSPDLGLIRFHLALAYEGQGDLDQARSTATAALAGFPAAPGEGEPQWVGDLRALQDRLRPAGG